MVIPENFDSFRKEARKTRNATDKFFKRMRKKKSKKVDAVFHEIDEEVFSKTDCLDCANCCKTTGPMFSQHDITRIAKHFRMKPGAFVEEYLRLDEDDDYVLKEVPCAFLGDDNHCGIYDIRPKACAEYPHFDQKDVYKVFKIGLENIEICPAAFEIVEKAKLVLEPNRSA